ncbi:pyridoxamine 5'-phosphate oxidase family protein [Rubellimicrobium rubrum]|uniref:Pyridoxamine 5'-phosphate oxidase family protein n=1 Tax=Rubellimicrobium rubrum TaxID=2585369 RepID=A0A5C4MX73_9RHOB|nr:pyridoxamine 5'-phosphate oxidase family protein [Rubellimicrobium rubrum]TNC50702.1 pyridoxamine 5'-phosphate oxidase family protein [Rubellimicrobium rubrum]
MAKQFSSFEAAHEAFIKDQAIYFVATAAPDGHVNVSPKGRDSLRILGPNRLAWRNLTGSGNETAAHLLRANRMTVMWCSFTTRPLILRAYGTASVIHRDEPGWDLMDALFPPEPGVRQIFDMSVELVQTSCGYAVPFMDFRSERDTLNQWAEAKGEDGVERYWQEKNRRSIDGFPTGLPE